MDSITKLTLAVVILQAATLIATILTVVFFFFTLKEAKATTKEARETTEEMTKAVEAIFLLSESTHVGQLWQKWHSPEVSKSRVFGQTFEKNPPSLDRTRRGNRIERQRKREEVMGVMK